MLRKVDLPLDAVDNTSELQRPRLISNASCASLPHHVDDVNAVRKDLNAARTFSGLEHLRPKLTILLGTEDRSTEVLATVSTRWLGVTRAPSVPAAAAAAAGSCTAVPASTPPSPGAAPTRRSTWTTAGWSRRVPASGAGTQARRRLRSAGRVAGRSSDFAEAPCYGLSRCGNRPNPDPERPLRCGAVLAFARPVDLVGALARPLAAGAGAVPGGAELVGHLRP